MVASYTTNGRFTKQGDNDNPNTWGQVLNQVIELVEESVFGVLALDVTGSSNVTLTTNNGSTDQSRHAVIRMTGAISTDIDLIVPAVEKVYVIDAQHTGGVVRVIPSGGSVGIDFENGDAAILYTNGTNIYRANKEAIDTIFTSLAVDDFLTYDGTTWVNTSLADVATLLGYSTLTGNNTFSGNVTFTGKVAYPDDGELTIASGAITVTGANHTVDTEADAGSDSLDTINGGGDGQILYLRQENSARDIIVTNAGNIVTPDGLSFNLRDTNNSTHMLYDTATSKWIAYTNNSLAGRIRQFKQTVDTTNRSTISTSYESTTVAATFDNAIAPGSSVRITVSCLIGSDSSSVRGGVAVYRGTPGTPTALPSASMSTAIYDNAQTDALSFVFYDTDPGVTANSYILYFKSTSSSKTIWLGRQGASAVPGASEAPTIITIEEITG